MTRKEIIAQLGKWGFHDLNFSGELCAYAQLRDTLRANKIALRDITALSMTEEGEVLAEFETGLNYASGYLLEYEEPALPLTNERE